MKNVLPMMVAVSMIVATLFGCGKDSGESVNVTTTPTEESSIVITDTSGDPVTSAVENDATTTSPQTQTVTEGTTEQMSTTKEAAKTTPATTTTKTPTTKPTDAPTTKAPTTTITTTPTTAATTAGKVANYDDPWKWPCDWRGMEADCKAYVESIGMHWDPNLNVDRGNWEGREITYWGEIWDNGAYDVFSGVKEQIQYDNTFSKSTYFKCVFIPDENYDGHYYIYVVHSSFRVDVNYSDPDYADLAKKAVN